MKVVTDSRISSEPRYPIGACVMSLMRNSKVYAELIHKHLPKGVKSICFVVRGSSGAIIAGVLCALMEVHDITCYIHHVKKSGENAHSANRNVNPGNYHIIVDDFIDSGETVSAIYNAISKASYHGQKTIENVDMLVVSNTVCSLRQNINFLDNLDILICGTVSSEFNEDYPGTEEIELVHDDIAF